MEQYVIQAGGGWCGIEPASRRDCLRHLGCGDCVGWLFRPLDYGCELMIAGIILLAISMLRDWRSQTFLPPNYLDGLLLCFSLLTAASLTTAIYRPNVMRAIREQWCCVILYFLAKRAFVPAGQRARVLCGMTMLSTCLALSAIASAVNWKHELAASGFTDALALRSRLTYPLGAFLGEWATIVLALLPFPTATLLLAASRRMRVWNFMCLSMVWTALWLSFTRGAYLGAGLFLVSVCVLLKVFPGGRSCCAGAGLVCAAAGLGLVAACGVNGDAVLGTASMGAGVSQIRSAEGRLALWRHLMQSPEAHSAFGIGRYNFPIVFGDRGGEAAARGFVTRHSARHCSS